MLAEVAPERITVAPGTAEVPFLAITVPRIVPEALSRILAVAGAFGGNVPLAVPRSFVIGSCAETVNVPAERFEKE
jgi:hypothetical protein